MALKIELRYGANSGFTFLNSFQAYVFYDCGAMWARNTPAATNIMNSRDSMGAGVRYNLNENITGFIEVNVPMSDQVTAEANKDARLFFSLAMRH